MNPIPIERKDRSVKQRIYRGLLRQHGLEYERRIEMAVDALNIEQGRNIQFWQDVLTYGLYEAYVSLYNDMVEKPIKPEMLTLLGILHGLILDAVQHCARKMVK